MYLTALAVKKPLGSQSQPRMHGHDIICVHTMVGSLASTYGYFKDGNGPGYRGTESHFGLGGAWGADVKARLDGVLWQLQDLTYTADANYLGNGEVISIETADNAPRSARDIVRWSPKQAAALIRAIAYLCSRQAHATCPTSWACHKVGIPAVLVPDTKRGRRGLAYHAQGVAGVGLVPGGVQWSTSRGKECPGPARISQLKSQIIPGVRAALAAASKPTRKPTTGGDMTSTLTRSGTTATKLKPGAWNYIAFDLGGETGYAPSLLRGPAPIALSAGLQLTGMKPGAEGHLRVIEVDDKAPFPYRRSIGYTTRFEGWVGGVTSAALELAAADVTAGRRLRLQVAVFEPGVTLHARKVTIHILSKG